MTMKMHIGHERTRGFTLVELMIGIVLGMLVITAITVVFVNVSRNRHDMERTGRQIENGRYATQLLADDLINAGYFGEFDPRLAGDPFGAGAGRPDPCSVTLTDFKNEVLFHVQGYPAASTKPTCLSDVKSNTAVIAVRRLSSCVAGAANCDAAAAGDVYFQSTLCDTELALPVPQRYIVAAMPTSGASPFNLNVRGCASAAVLRKYVMNIYFVANNDNAGDGIPTLKRAELSGGAFTIVPLVEGIEDFQVEYGLDTNGDGVPDVLTPDPGSYNGCSLDPCYRANWLNAMTATIHVLSRATETSPDYKDTKAYTVGLNADSTDHVDGPFNDGYKRHVYSESVRMNNPAGRRE
jgi:type IV pilus assembly protein PilW